MGSHFHKYVCDISSYSWLSAEYDWLAAGYYWLSGDTASYLGYYWLCTGGCCRSLRTCGIVWDYLGILLVVYGIMLVI